MQGNGQAGGADAQGDPPRIWSVDYLRVVLAAFVVLAHSGLAREALREAGTAGLWGLALGNGVLRVAVPIFTLIAGYFLAGVIRRGRISGWAGHLLALYAGWSVAYLLFLWPYYATRPAALTLSDLTLGFMHLWFLEGLAIAGIALAALSAGGRVAVIASAIVLGVAGMALQYAGMADWADIPVEHYRNGPLYLFPYLAMGWLIASAPPRRTPHRLTLPLLWALVGLGLALSVAESAWWLSRIGEEPLLEMPVGHLLFCPAALLLVMRLRVRPCRLPLGRAAAGIYVMHVIVLQGLPMLGIPHPAWGAVLGVALPFALVCAVSVAGRRYRGLARLF